MPTESKLHRSGYTTSIVTVFSGVEISSISREYADRLRESPPQGIAELPPSGFIFQWADGLALVSRAQGPDRQRIEVRAEGTVWPTYAEVHDLLTKVIDTNAGDRVPVTVGINSTMSLLGPLAVVKEYLARFFDTGTASKLVRRRRLYHGEISFAADVLDSRLTVKLTPGAVSGKGDLRGLLVDVNFSRPVKSGDQIETYIAEDRLEPISVYANSLFNRFERAN